MSIPHSMKAIRWMGQVFMVERISGKVGFESRVKKTELQPVMGSDSGDDGKDE